MDSPPTAPPAVDPPATDAGGFPLSALDQYRCLTEGTALVDRSAVGQLRVSGSDAIDLLDRLTTNDLRQLQPGVGLSTVLTTNKGRIMDLLRVFHRGDHLLILLSRESLARVAEWIDFYVFEEDVELTDVTDLSFVLGVAGPGAASTVSSVTGVSGVSGVSGASGVTGSVAADMPLHGLAETRVGGLDALVTRSDFLGPGGFEFIVSSDGESALAAAVGQYADCAGPGATEPLRIERGLPAPGSELNEDHNPLEAGLIDSINFNKGCYVGQEVVARLHTYDKVQRHLAVLRWAEGGAPAGDELTADGGRVGVMTSVATHPEGGHVGLAYVRRSFAGNRASLRQAGITATLRRAGR